LHSLGSFGGKKEIIKKGRARDKTNRQMELVLLEGLVPLCSLFHRGLLGGGKRVKREGRKKKSRRAKKRAQEKKGKDARLESFDCGLTRCEEGEKKGEVE